MNDNGEHALSEQWAAIQQRSIAIGFDMPSDPRTAAILKLLAASKRGARILEIGTGTGLATAALLSGMTQDATLISVDNDERLQSVARAVLGEDRRVTFVLEDGLSYIRAQPPGSFDLVFADAMPGKYDDIDAALALVRPGGLYVGDDMLPQDNWPEGHQARVDELISHLKRLTGWTAACLGCGSGFVLAVRMN